MTTLASSVRSVLISASEVGSAQSFQREALLFCQQQNAASLFFIESGLVKLTRTSNDGRKQILSVNGPYQLAGEECLLSGSELYRFDAQCLTDVTAYQIPVQSVQRLFGIPEFAAAIVNYVLRRDMDFIKRLELLVRHDVEHRILHGLAELARIVKPAGDGSSFPIPMTQAEIASFVGATRETTSTMLSILQSRRLVMLSRRLVNTVHPDILLEAASNGLAQSHSAN